MSPVGYRVVVFNWEGYAVSETSRSGEYKPLAAFDHEAAVHIAGEQKLGEGQSVKLMPMECKYVEGVNAPRITHLSKEGE